MSATGRRPPDYPTQVALAQLCALGGARGEAALETLLAAYEPLVVRLARKSAIGAQAGQFEDLCQEARIALIRAIRAWDWSTGSALGGYARSAITNHLINLYRVARAGPPLVAPTDDEVATADGRAAPSVADLPDLRGDPATLHDESEIDGAVGLFYRDLPRRERLLLALRHGLDGRREHEWEEIAAALDLPLDLVWLGHARGLAALCDRLAEAEIASVAPRATPQADDGHGAAAPV